MNIRRTAVMWVLVPACLAIGACHDAPAAPSALETPVRVVSESRAQQTVVSPAVAAAGLEGLRDALERIHTALVPDDRAMAVAMGLRQAIAALERDDSPSVSGALRSLDLTLKRYTPRDEAMSPDLDALRLAIDAATAR